MQGKRCVKLRADQGLLIACGPCGREAGHECRGCVDLFESLQHEMKKQTAGDALFDNNGQRHAGIGRAQVRHPPQELRTSHEHVST